MEFAVCDYAPRTFEHVCAELEHDPEAVLQSATDRLGIDVLVRAEPLVMLGPEIASLRATWSDRLGARLVAELRILGVSRGADAVTELLLIGDELPRGGERSHLARLAKLLLAELADRPAHPAVPEYPEHPYSRLLASELVRRGG